MAIPEEEDRLLHSVALQNANSILIARQRAEGELKAALEALRQSEEQLRAIFNQAAVGITTAGLDGRFLDMNLKFSEILGYKPAELAGRTFIELTHPGDLELTRREVQRLIAGEISEYVLEKRYFKKDGSIVWSLTTVTILKDQAGKPQRFIGVIEDISARKRVELALREETRLLELLNDAGSTLASQLDLHQLVQAVTDAATQLSGAEFGAFFYNAIDEGAEAFGPYTLSGVSRETFEAFGRPRATALFPPTFRGEPPIRVDDLLRDPRYGAMGHHQGMPKGQLRVRSYLAVPVASRSGQTIGGLFFGHSRPRIFTERAERLIVAVAAQAGVAIDNARLYEAAQMAAEERKVLLESERAARTAAEKASELKDEFLATLSHELRTPLNAILGWSQVLRASARDATDYAKGLDAIERNARVQTQLIEDLLDMSRVTSGKLRLDVQPLQPVTFVEAAVETVRPSADAKGIRLEYQFEPAAGLISGDPGRLQQVVWNLLSNAIKFTPRGGTVRVVLERVNSQVEISVADTGVGIRQEFIPYLFERFRQGDASTTRKFGGLGLGLSIVKSLVELHGGNVRVRSEGEGLGTTVTVELPLTIVHGVAEGPVHASTAGDGAAAVVPGELTGLKILVVDDQADARDLIQRVLEDAGGLVLTASGGAAALEIVQTQRPDVLVSDIGMPEVDGYQLLRQVRALGPDRGGRIPAIALTAFARSEDRTRALRAGFVVHVAKPVDPAELTATVASAAGRLYQP